MERFLTVGAAALGFLTVCMVAIFVAYTAGRFSQDGGQARADDRVSYQESGTPQTVDSRVATMS